VSLKLRPCAEALIRKVKSGVLEATGFELHEVRGAHRSKLLRRTLTRVNGEVKMCQVYPLLLSHCALDSMLSGPGWCRPGHPIGDTHYFVWCSRLSLSHTCLFLLARGHVLLTK
jgi:hypothetical protein